MRTTKMNAETQERFANEDGFSVFDPQCHVCGEDLEEGMDCSSRHYRQWLTEKEETMKKAMTSKTVETGFWKVTMTVAGAYRVTESRYLTEDEARRRADRWERSNSIGSYRAKVEFVEGEIYATEGDRKDGFVLDDVDEDVLLWVRNLDSTYGILIEEDSDVRDYRVVILIDQAPDNVGEVGIGVFDSWRRAVKAGIEWVQKDRAKDLIAEERYEDEDDLDVVEGTLSTVHYDEGGYRYGETEDGVQVRTRLDGDGTLERVPFGGSDSYWNPEFRSHLEKVAEVVNAMIRTSDVGGIAKKWTVEACQTGGGVANLIATHPDLPGVEIVFGTADGTWGWCVQEWETEGGKPTGDIVRDGSEEFGAAGETIDRRYANVDPVAWDARWDAVAEAVTETILSWIW